MNYSKTGEVSYGAFAIQKWVLPGNSNYMHFKKYFISTLVATTHIVHNVNVGCL